MKFLDLLGLTEFFNNLKTYFAPLIHKHTKADIEDLVEVQSDWNQNDPNAADYVKNRIGGYYVDEEAILFDDDLIFEYDEGAGASVRDQGFDLVLGETYQLVIDGVEYEPTVCKEYKSMYATYNALGNPSLHNEYAENSGEDYLWMDNFAFYMSGKSHVTVSVKILGKAKEIVPIDENFIPSSIARNSEVASTYIKDLSTSGSTLTFTKGDDTTATIEIEDDDLITTEASGEVVGEEPTLNPVAEARISSVEASLVELSNDMDEIKNEVVETIQADIAEIDKKIVQSDWNQADDTAIDYIKNKPVIPSDEDIAAMFVDMNAFNLAYADAEGTTAYTDNDGKVLIY